jgi:hypothetical protein
MQEDWTTIGESKAEKYHLILSRKKAQRGEAATKHSLSSTPWRRGLGRGGAFLLGIPLSSILSPLVPHGARRKQN